MVRIYPNAEKYIRVIKMEAVRSNQTDYYNEYSYKSIRNLQRQTD